MSNNKPKNNYAGDTTKISGYDVCQTPKHALEPLYPMLDILRQTYYRADNTSGICIWESAHGPDKILVQALVDKGFFVWDTDLATGHNYFEYEPTQEPGYEGEYIIQVTNPPWSIKYPWIERAFELHFPFALLVPYETTAAAVFQRLADTYYNNPWPIEVLAPERRINFKMPNKGWDGSSAQMPVIWLTWGLNVDQCYDEPYIDTYRVPMRSVKYDERNNEL